MAAMASASASDTDGLPKPRRYWAIVAISFGTALLVLDGAIANVALPTIARDLGVTNAAVTNVVAVYQLVLVMALLPFSSLGDRIGHRWFYQAGQLLFLVASALCLFANGFIVLLLLRALQALGAATALAPTAGGFIVGHAPWQWVFVAAVPLAFVSLLLGRALPEPVRKDQPAQWISGLWSALTMLLLIGGLQLATHENLAIGTALA